MKNINNINLPLELFQFNAILNTKMNLNDASVLEKINRLIASNRLNKKQILQIVNLASISNSISELIDNMQWENFKSKN